MNRSRHFSRRFVLAAGAGAPILAVGGADPMRAAAPEGRPDFRVSEAGPGRWRWLSWRHDGEYWRPVRGDIRAAGPALVVRGALPAADRAAMLDALGAAAAGRRVSLVRES
ncbi:hypothetical protein OK349_09380 [Sphingomonas sp. BT-65]|uniref:hypothetical protein n=1 Tax=Sphingomonas sp. BT-65 TaxID=2989821 RepID=UPI00223684E6|nr:hypothetical protein [Sphingomonas sp. BT-65]MCW4461919.1 hypothetical protein [Sphingomonas sp. BT-65]